MPSATRLLALAVSIWHTVEAGRLSNMGSHLLRHFAHNHLKNKASQRRQLISVKNNEPVQLPQEMRFKAAPGFDPSQQEKPNPYTYASATGNGAKDFMTPYYGSFSHSYGPVYQLLTPVSGYGGYPGTIDPRGFNAPTQNFTHGVFIAPLNAPPQIGTNGRLATSNPSILGNPVLPGFKPGILGTPVLPGVPGLLRPVAGPQLHYIPARGLHTVVGQIPGTIPLVYPNGASQGLSDGIALRPAVAAGVSLNAVPALQSVAGVSPAHPVLAATAPLHPFQASALGVAPGVVPLTGMSSAVPGLGFKSPYNPSFSTGMMQHHQLTLNGAANGFGTPGFFHPLSEHYPTPDADAYNSVLRNPVLPPNYGKENEGSGSGAAA